MTTENLSYDEQFFMESKEGYDRCVSGMEANEAALAILGENLDDWEVSDYCPEGSMSRFREDATINEYITIKAGQIFTTLIGHTWEFMFDLSRDEDLIMARRLLAR